MDFKQADTSLAGCRFFLSYSGAAPTGANCATLASDIATQWGTDLQGLTSNQFGLSEVDVLDIATLSGLSGQWTGTKTGGNAGTYLPAQTAVNVEFNIARRYRGGKPRMYHPPMSQAETADPAHWDATHIGSFNAAITNFFAGIEALSVGAIGTLQHVNLSYYQGFRNITNSSGRERAVPTYRAAALLDTITGYSTKGLFGSQRRRRNATTY